ncbi:MAG: hypothetical protein ACE5FF_06255 [Saprospiraceae bacterium]
MKTHDTPDYYASFYGEIFYHVYNRANGEEVLFRADTDRQFFLRQYGKYLSPFLKTLLGNHFHLVVKVKSTEQITAYLESLQPNERTIPQKIFLEAAPDFRVLHPVLENQFLRLFTSYAMRYNKLYQRKGNLFHRLFKRVAVNSEAHFGNFVYYVHANCRKHGFQHDFVDYPWSSYGALLSSKPTRLDRHCVRLVWRAGCVYSISPTRA